MVSIPKFNHLCHSSVSLEKPVGSNVVIIGASSFLGSRIAIGFEDAGYRVTALEDTINLLIEPLAWYRWDQLSKKGLPPKYLDFNDSSEIRSALKDHKSGTIFYIPSAVFDGLENQRTFKTSHNSHTLKNFVKLLEIVRTDYLHDLRVVLLTLPNHAALSIQKAWLRTFELSLSSFQYLYGLNVAVLKVDGVYGPWQDQNISLKLHTKHWYIDDIEKLLMTVTKDNKVCQEIDLGTGVETSKGIGVPMNWTTFSDGILKTKAWNEDYNHYIQSKRTNVIMSTYFSLKTHSLYKEPFLTDHFRFMSQWFLSAQKIRAHLVIFHDNLTLNFQKRLKSFYPLVQFVHKGDFGGWSSNDARFYMQYDYLLKHPEIRSVVLTDIRDVKLFGNPFNVMDVIGDYMYVGIDVSYLPASYDLQWVRDMKRICHRKENSEYLKLHPFYNAGIVGGTRHTVLAYLTQMTKYLKKTPRSNCNMITTNIITNKHFHDFSFTGYPLQSGFKLGTANPKGQAIKHKDTG